MFPDVQEEPLLPNSSGPFTLHKAVRYMRNWISDSVMCSVSLALSSDHKKSNALKLNAEKTIFKTKYSTYHFCLLTIN